MDAPPSATDPDRSTIDRFVVAYARSERPRITLLWNRELTAEVETGREYASTLSVEREPDRLDAERRSNTCAHDSGARMAASSDEGVNFDMEPSLADGRRAADRPGRDPAHWVPT